MGLWAVLSLAHPPATGPGPGDRVIPEWVVPTVSAVVFAVVALILAWKARALTDYSNQVRLRREARTGRRSRARRVWEMYTIAGYAGAVVIYFIVQATGAIRPTVKTLLGFEAVTLLVFIGWLVVRRFPARLGRRRSRG